jgi:hypothetical protein
MFFVMYGINIANIFAGNTVIQSISRIFIKLQEIMIY